MPVASILSVILLCSYCAKKKPGNLKHSIVLPVELVYMTLKEFIS